MTSIADMCEIAINEHLWDGVGLESVAMTHEYSCTALSRASNFDAECTDRISHFVRSLGCSTTSAFDFSDIPTGGTRQYARALWLTWVEMIAREEGL